MKRRHIYFWNVFRPLVILYLKYKFSYRYEVAKDLPDNYIVLSNHVTDYDPLMVAASFPRQMYFVGSEHIARWKTLYRFLEYAFEPIIRYKGTVAGSTVMDILRKTRKGANVCVFAEGVRTWDGVTTSILPSTAKLIKSSGCGLVTYKIEGGYFASPMWSKSSNTRKGYVHGRPVQVYAKEQLAEMSQDEIYEVIQKDLYEDAYEKQLQKPRRYRGKRLAEGLENLLFVCPECGERDTICTCNDTVKCKACGTSFTYDEFGMFKKSRFKTVREYVRWQKEQIRDDVKSNRIYTAKSAKLSTVAKHVETYVTEGPLSMSVHALKCGEVEIPLEHISDMAMHGKRAIVFGANKKYYELIPSEEISAFKFQLFFEEWRQQRKG